MDSAQDKIIEAELRKAVRKAFRRLLKEIKNEPELVIEASSDNTEADPTLLEDVQNWLFVRREGGKYNDD